MHPDKKKFISHKNIPYTQALFLEMGYNPEVAVYTLKDFDYEYEGVVYPSIKRLYLAMEDVIEYDFANTYFLSWNHWKRLCENKQIRKYIDEWRTELELKLTSQAVRNIIEMTADERGFQAAKYVAERGWNKGKVGRPKADNTERDNLIEQRLNDEFAEDVARLQEKEA